MSDLRHCRIPAWFDAMFPTFKTPPGPIGRRLFELMRRRAASGRRAPTPMEVEHLLRGADIAWGRAVHAGTTLADARRFAEADAVLERGLSAFPLDPTLSIAYALSAHIAGVYRIAIVRWQAALAVAARDPLCHYGLAANFREVGDIENAGSIIAPALQSFPENPGVVCEAARIAEAAGRFSEALSLWARLVRRPEPDPEWLRGHGHSLMVLGRFDEAEVVVASALERHPDKVGLLAVRAMIASAREDWPKALALWADFRRRFPNDRTGWEHHGRTVQASALAERDASSALPRRAPLDVPRQEDDEIRRLLLRFESIGDNCEFGSVQRRYGAEPLGLLRWNDVRFEELLAALGERFAGMGEPDHTDMPTLANGEFVVRDRRWGLWMHTFLFEGQVDRAELYVKMCRRVAYLRDKLLSDIESADKVFVFRSAGLDGAQIEQLHEALAAIGPVRLLSVQPSTSASGFAGAPGEVLRIDPGRSIGFLRKLGVAEGNYWDIAFDDWVAICRAAA